MASNLSETERCTGLTRIKLDPRAVNPRNLGVGAVLPRTRTALPLLRGVLRGLGRTRCGLRCGLRLRPHCPCGRKSVVGIDIDAQTIAYAQEHFVHPRVSFAESSAEQLSQLGQTFDVVVSFETIEHLPEPARFIAEVRRVLRPGGLFLCSTPNRDFAGKEDKNANPYHLSEMSFTEFSAAFAEHFRSKSSITSRTRGLFCRHCKWSRNCIGWPSWYGFSKLLRFENWLRRL